jgi:mannose-6-phosphate isomerase-like protein (cupin superfamily)
MATVVNTGQRARELAAPESPADAEALHREAEGRVQPFHFLLPDDMPPNAKTYFNLAKTDLVGAQVQIVPQGGENNLHYHTGEDGFWMVLKGRARFHGPDGPTGEYGPMQGVLMPRNARYWFEAVDCGEDLHILHISGRQPRDNRRVDVKPRTEQFKRSMHVDLAAPEGQKVVRRQAS